MAPTPPPTARVVEALSEAFETKSLPPFPVATGSAAKRPGARLRRAALGGDLTAMRKAHIETDECGAPEFFTAGAKIVKVQARTARIDPATLESDARGGADRRRALGP